MEHEMEHEKKKPHDGKSETAAQESQHAAARAAGSVKDDITPAPHPVSDAIDELSSSDNDGGGH